MGRSLAEGMREKEGWWGRMGHWGLMDLAGRIALPERAIERRRCG